MIELLLQIVPFILLVALSLTVGRAIERRHLLKLAQGRLMFADMLVTDLRTMPHADTSLVPTLVIGEATISANYLRSFLAGLKKIIGGELHMYQTLITRAREEAILRMMTTAREAGYDAISNLRLETVDIAGVRESRRNKNAMSTVIAYGTAYRRLPHG